LVFLFHPFFERGDLEAEIADFDFLAMLGFVVFTAFFAEFVFLLREVAPTVAQAGFFSRQRSNDFGAGLRLQREFRQQGIRVEDGQRNLSALFERSGQPAFRFVALAVALLPVVGYPLICGAQTFQSFFVLGQVELLSGSLLFQKLQPLLTAVDALFDGSD